MKNTLLLLACSLFVVSCIDENYDLSNIDTDKISIGDQDTEFRVPLALIHIGSDEIDGNIDGNSISLVDFFHEADIWLPEPLPGGATDIDVEKLQSDGNYLLELTDALIEQMKIDDQKIDAVAGLIYDKYQNQFDFPGLPADQFTRDEYLMAFRAAFRSEEITLGEQLSAAIRNQAGQYLNKMDQIDPMAYDLGEIEVGGDVLDMIVGDAADDEVVGALYGWIESRIPAELEIRPVFANTSVEFTLKLLLDQRSDFEEVEITRKDLEQIFNNARVDVTLRLLRYTPRAYNPSLEQLTIRMSLLKKGGLNL